MVQEKRKVKVSELKAGDRIMIRIGAKPVLTYIDERGIQRILPNRIIRDVAETNRSLDLNMIAALHAQGNYSLQEYLEYDLLTNWSVCGFCELSRYQFLDVDNPVWDSNSDDPVVELEPVPEKAPFAFPLVRETNEHTVSMIPMLIYDATPWRCMYGDHTGFMVTVVPFAETYSATRSIVSMHDTYTEAKKAFDEEVKKYTK